MHWPKRTIQCTSMVYIGVSARLISPTFSGGKYERGHAQSRRPPLVKEESICASECLPREEALYNLIRSIEDEKVASAW